MLLRQCKMLGNDASYVPPSMVFFSFLFFFLQEEGGETGDTNETGGGDLVLDGAGTGSRALAPGSSGAPGG